MFYLFVMMYILGIPNAAIAREKADASIWYILLWPFWSLFGLAVVAFRR
jgi:hypothetical protein